MAGGQGIASSSDMSQAAACKNSCSRVFTDGSLKVVSINSMMARSMGISEKYVIWKVRTLDLLFF